MSAGVDPTASTRKASGWITLLVLFGIASTSEAFFFFGLPLVPFWGVWSERYGRIPIIARSAFVEMVVFAGLWLAQNRWEAAFALLLVGLPLGNTRGIVTALRAGP